MSAAVSPDVQAVQRRTVRVLVAGQVLGGISIGSVLAIGAVLAAEVSGSEAWSGAAATLSTLGAAASAIPLARLAQRLGRRPALTAGVLASAVGAVITVAAAAWVSFPLLLAGFALLGAGAAVNLQSRFAATDVASPERRGRDLSLVVWSTTIGAVLGPNLFAPGQVLGEALGMPALTGPFAIALVAQISAAAVYFVWLRPDPYLLSRTLPAAVEPTVDSLVRARSLLIFAIGSIAISHAVMVSVMAMTPVHLVSHGATLAIVGFTISLHIGGMFALAPLFGWLSDKLGRIPTIVLGQGLLLSALAVVALGERDTVLIGAGLVVLGLGWSASTVSGSALVADLATGAARAKIQGRTDLIMNLAGAAGGAAAGLVLSLIGYAGLAVSAGMLVLLVAGAAAVLSLRGRTAPGQPAATGA